MLRKKQHVFTFLLIFALVLSSLFSAATAEAADEFTVEAQAAIAIDAETGKVFYSQNGDTPMGIASITKILAMYIVLEEIDKGSLSWDTPVAISEKIATLSVHPELSNVPLYQDYTYTVKELFDASMIQSANAAVMALAEHIAGSEKAFVDRMREKLKEWSITDGYIVTTSGLNNEYLSEDDYYPGSSATDENKLSARDVAIIARHLINDYPEILNVTKTTSEDFGVNTPYPVEMVNWNWLLPGFLGEKEGVDGLKTGTTDYAGACFVGTMEKDGQRVITVVLHADNQEEDPNARFVETGELMDYCYENWQLQEVGTAGQTIASMKSIEVIDGKQETVAVALANPVTLWVRKDYNEKDIKIDILDAKDSIKAPVKANTKVGTASLSMAQDSLGYVDKDVQYTTTIQTTSAVKKGNFFELTWRNISNFFGDLF